MSEELIEQVYFAYAASQGWTSSVPHKNSYGYHTFQASVQECLEKGVSPENVHNGWIKAYTYWRDNKPWESQPDKYRKPYKELNDERRNKLAVMEYKDLPQDEQEKDELMAKAIQLYIK